MIDSWLLSKFLMQLKNVSWSVRTKNSYLIKGSVTYYEKGHNGEDMIQFIPYCFKGSNQYDKALIKNEPSEVYVNGQCILNVFNIC